MKLRSFIIHVFVAFAVAICLPAFAADYSASIPCGGAATLTPADPIVRLKGAGDTLTFDLVPQAGVALSVKNWKINGDPIFEDNEDTMKQAGANWGIFTPTNDRKSLSWKLGGTKDGSFKLTAVLKRSCGGPNPNAAPEPDQKDEDLDLWDGTVVSVTFNPTVIKTGYVIPIQNVDMPEIKTIVTATVTPNTETNNIVFPPDPAMQNRAAITEPLNNRNAATGTITLWIKGTSATPSNQPTGDMKILAKVKNTTPVVGSANVIVVVPTKYTVAMQDQNQGIAFKGQVTGHNEALGRHTIPTNNAMLETEVSLNTLYSTNFVVQVVDQFSNPLDAMYQGQPVTEKKGTTIRVGNEVVTGYPDANDAPINQWLSAGGTYSDTVAVNILKIVDGVPAVVQNKGTPLGIQQIADWKAAIPIPLSVAEQDGRIYIGQDWLVRVGGHGLINPYFTAQELIPGAASITRRIAGFPNGFNGDGADKKPNTLIILWDAITAQEDNDLIKAFNAP